MGFRYQFCTADGEIFREAEYAYQPSAGDEVYVDGHPRRPVTTVVPLELAGEFVDRPRHGMLEVEPCAG